MSMDQRLIVVRITIYSSLFSPKFVDLVCGVGEREIDVFFHLYMQLMIDSCMCPVWGLNPQPW